MARAGRSAWAEYERRRAREVEHQRANRKLWVAFTVVTPVVVYSTVRFGLPWLTNMTWASIVEASKTESNAPDVIGPRTAHLAALLAAFGATANVMRSFWGRRQPTEAWARGAEGEERTARLLERLPKSFSVRHDLSMPGSRANIDHVVVGPTGVFTIETKNYRGGVRIAGGRLIVGGRRRDGITEQAGRQARVISDLTGVPARALVVVHGGVSIGWFASPVVDGVQICTPSRLLKILKGDAETLSSEQVTTIVERL